MSDHGEHTDRDVAGRSGPQGPGPGSPPPGARPEDKANQALSDALRGSFRFLKYAMIALVGFYLLKGVFWVEPQEVKFKTQFGQVVKAKGRFVLEPGSGIYVRWPWEEVQRVRTDEKTLELSREFWPEAGQEQMRPSQTLNVRNDGYLLTGDANIVHMKLRVRYRVNPEVTDVLSYALEMENPELVLRRMTQAAAGCVVGSTDVMQVFRREGDLFGRIQTELEARLKAFEKGAGMPLGIQVVKVEGIETQGAKNPSEPGMVVEAFNQAQTAESAKDQRMREGEAEAAKILNGATADAQRIREEAQADAVTLVKAAEADALTLQQILPIYRQSAAVARILRLMFHQRAMEDLMQNAPGAFVFYRSPAGTTRVLTLQHTRTPIEKVRVPGQQAPGQTQ